MACNRPNADPLQVSAHKGTTSECCSHNCPQGPLLHLIGRRLPPQERTTMQAKAPPALSRIDTVLSQKNNFGQLTAGETPPKHSHDSNANRLTAQAIYQNTSREEGTCPFSPARRGNSLLPDKKRGAIGYRKTKGSRGIFLPLWGWLG